MVRRDMSAIFTGVPPVESRKALALIAAKHPDKRFAFPFAGRFAAVQAVLKAGIKPEKVLTSDIGLLSSTVGYLVSGQPLSDLGVRFLDERLDPLVPVLEDGSEVDKAAAILYAIKFSQLRAQTNYYVRSGMDELLVNRERYMATLRDAATENMVRMKGIVYRIRDAREEVRDLRDDPNAIVFLDPPNYRRGYVKMFPFDGVLKWNEPTVPQFDQEGDYRAMLDDLTDAPVTAVAYTESAPTLDNHAKVTPPGWATIFAMVYTRGSAPSVLYLVSNRIREVLPVSRNIPPLVTHARKIFHDGIDLTPETKVGIVWISDGEAAYYRDLFVHRLGTTRSEMNGLILLDDHLFGVFGVQTNFALRRGFDYVFWTYGVNAHSDRYLRSHRLFTRLITSGDFLRVLSVKVNFGPNPPVKLRTAGIARLRDVRSYGGIMTLVSRMREKGMYHLVYDAFFDPDTSFATAITAYLDELEKEKRRRARAERKPGKPKKKRRSEK